jgi:HEAT repeat protein
LVHKFLKDPDPVRRCLAAQAVWRIEGDTKGALAVLRAALKDPEDFARDAAAFNLALLKAEAKPAEPELRAALQDPYAKVRRHAAYTLLQIDRNDKAAAPVFVQALRQTGLTSGAYPETRLEPLRQLSALAVNDKEAASLLQELIYAEPYRTWAALEPLLKKVGVRP